MWDVLLILFVSNIYSTLMTVWLSALQTLITVCEQCANDYEIMYNTKKAGCMAVLAKCLLKLNVPTMYINGNSLQWVDEHKCLGIVIRKDFADNNRDGKWQMRAIYGRGNVIISKFKHCIDDVKRKVAYRNIVQLWNRVEF